MIEKINEMNLEIKEYPFGSRPDVVRPDSRILSLLGEDGMRQLVSDHYDLLVQSPIKGLFPDSPEGVERAKKNSADFFIQYLGGPDYFNQNRGRPMMAARHSPFTISPAGRRTWLECYREVLLKLNMEEEILISYWNYLEVFSQWMVNTPK